ncbi:hypothetical protein QYF61_002173 [Mycteria americana]|uniref:Uncharacterized protein n=1 Tax=Mycteria americana TaxID=33587 RepID=A0AAN7NGT8_MYCAM|nr:hypothetical protein QYF61_002173 [Mycteria americana]
MASPKVQALQQLPHGNDMLPEVWRGLNMCLYIECTRSFNSCAPESRRALGNPEGAGQCPGRQRRGVSWGRGRKTAWACFSSACTSGNDGDPVPRGKAVSVKLRLQSRIISGDLRLPQRRPTWVMVSLLGTLPTCPTCISRSISYRSLRREGLHCSVQRAGTMQFRTLGTVTLELCGGQRKGWDMPYSQAPIGMRGHQILRTRYLIQTSFKYLQGWRLNHFPGQSVPMLDNPLGEEKFPNIQSKPPLAQLEAISSCPITCYLGEETDPHLSTTSFQVVVESDEVSPQPPFLQAKQSQLPQPLLIRLLLQTLHQLRCPSLYALQYLNKEHTGSQRTVALGMPVPMLDNPFSKDIFPNIQSKPLLTQLEAISSHPVASYLGEETDTHLTTTSFQAVVESDEVSPQPPFLQTKQPQFPQPLLIRLVLQTLHELRCPSLHTLQPLNVSLVYSSAEYRGTITSLGPAGHTISDTSQDAVGFLGHLGTLLAHIEPAVKQHPQVLFRLAACQPLFPKPVALHGVVVTQPVQIPLQSLPTLKQINTAAQLGVVCKLTEGALNPLTQIIDKDIKQNWPQN